MTDTFKLNLAQKAMIEIPKDKLSDLVKAVYKVSVPVGMGMMHYSPGPIPEKTLQAILDNPRGIGMDYIHGRQCKFSVREVEGRYFISKEWPDHTKEDLRIVLRAIGINPAELL